MSYEKIKNINTRLKHLRGRHDQLDHAWNRGMGRGGGGAALAPNQQGPVVSQDFYRKRKVDLMDQKRQGLINNAEMRRQLDELQGKISNLPVTTNITNNQTNTNNQNNTTNFTLANRNVNISQIANTIAQRLGSTVQSIRDRLAQLRTRRESTQPTQTVDTTQPTQTTPTLPTNYDTTRFDTPSELAPRPVRAELLQPGGEIYEAIYALYEQGGSLPFGEDNADIYQKAADNLISYPTNRPQFSTLNALESQINELIRDYATRSSTNILEYLGIDPTEYGLPSFAESEQTNLDGQVFYNFDIYGQEFPQLQELIPGIEQHPVIQQKRKALQDMINDPANTEWLQSESGQNWLSNQENNIAKAMQRLSAFIKLSQTPIAQSTTVLHKYKPLVERVISEIQSKMDLMQSQLKDPTIDESVKNTLQDYINQIDRQLRFFKNILDSINIQFPVDENGNPIPPSMNIIMQSISPTDTLSIISKIIGNEGKPTVANWNDMVTNGDALTDKDGPLIMYRSIRSSDETGFNSQGSGMGANLTAEQIYESTIDSDTMHIGKGVDGMGFYIKSRSESDTGSAEEKNLQALAATRTYGTHTMAVILNKNARIYTTPIRNSYELEKLTKQLEIRYGISSVDPGILMALLGWQAYAARDGQSGINWVALDRSILTISSELLQLQTYSYQDENNNYMMGITQEELDKQGIGRII